MVYRKKRVSRPRRIARKPVRKNVMSAKLVKEVKTLVHKPLKYTANQWSRIQPAQSVNTVGGAQLYQIIPYIQQGTNEDQRISDRVLPHKYRTHFTLYLDQTMSQTQDLFVRFICVTLKQVKSYSSIGGFPGNNLLNQGDGTVIDPPATPGTTLSVMTQYSKYPINTKDYNVHYDRVHRLVKNQGDATGSGTGNAVPNTPHGIQHHFVINHKDFPTQLKYDSATSVNPNNYAPFWCAYSWTASGSDFSGGFITIAPRSEMWYTDA